MDIKINDFSPEKKHYNHPKLTRFCLFIVFKYLQLSSSIFSHYSLAVFSHSILCWFDVLFSGDFFHKFLLFSQKDFVVVVVVVNSKWTLSLWYGIVRGESQAVETPLTDWHGKTPLAPCQPKKVDCSQSNDSVNGSYIQCFVLISSSVNTILTLVTSVLTSAWWNTTRTYKNGFTLQICSPQPLEQSWKGSFVGLISD